MQNRIVLGLIEDVTIKHKDIKKKIKARIDTGAKSNSIDKELAAKIGIFPGKTTTIVKSAMGTAKRYVVNLDVEIAGLDVRGRFTLSNRSKLKYPVLIGRNILKKGFLIDPKK